jgi:protein-tyrosine phosphatase
MAAQTDPEEPRDRAPGDWPHDDVLHAYWVEPGQILAGEHPGSSNDPARTRRNVNLLVDHGIRTFVDLTSPDDPLEPYAAYVDEAAAQRDLDLQWLRRPIPDMGIVDADEYDAIVDTIRRSAERGGVYLHCWGGVGRTGTVVGCLLIDGGLNGEEALAQIAAWRSTTRKAHMRAPETDAQLAVLRRRAER